MKRILCAVLLFLICTSLFAEAVSEAGDKIKIKVLILPKFENGEMAGDFPGEAQLYYECFVKGGDEYTIPGGFEDHKLYVKDGVALYVTGIGKVNTALSTMAVLSDTRFDFSEAYILSTGCCGSPTELTVMGDVIIATACADKDLGHMADWRDLADKDGNLWFHDEIYDSSAIVFLSEDLTERVYELVKDVPLNTTENTRRFMAMEFGNAQWALRDPKVIKGTVVTSDNYGKGYYFEEIAKFVAETYGCKDFYAATEMEEVAVGVALQRLGMLDRLIVVRISVNMDVYMMGATPESLWTTGSAANLSDEDSIEAVDIFEVGMENNFKVGQVIINAILEGRL